VFVFLVEWPVLLPVLVPDIAMFATVITVPVLARVAVDPAYALGTF